MRRKNYLLAKIREKQTEEIKFQVRIGLTDLEVHQKIGQGYHQRISFAEICPNPDKAL